MLLMKMKPQNYNETDEVSQEDLEAAAEFYDRLMEKQKKTMTLQTIEKIIHEVVGMKFGYVLILSGPYELEKKQMMLRTGTNLPPGEAMNYLNEAINNSPYFKYKEPQDTQEDKKE